MGCTATDPKSYCNIYRHYIAVGNNNYHGELCADRCLKWVSSDADKAALARYTANAAGRINKPVNRRNSFAKTHR